MDCTRSVHYYVKLRFYKFFANYKDIWKMKWFNGTLFELSFLVFFLIIVHLLYPKIEGEYKSGTQPDFDEFANEHKSDDFKILELTN